MARTIMFNGEKYFYNGRDYFRNARGQLLHRVMWEYHNGPIPKGHIVHHIDGDKLHNSMDNFELMPRGEHVRHHYEKDGPQGAAKWTGEQRAAATKRGWQNKKPIERICGYCHQPYTSTSTYSSWCSVKCRVAARYHGLSKRRAD